MDVLGEALAAAKCIEDAGDRAWALIAIAGTQALAGDTQGAARHHRSSCRCQVHRG